MLTHASGTPCLSLSGGFSVLMRCHTPAWRHAWWYDCMLHVRSSSLHMICEDIIRILIQLKLCTYRSEPSRSIVPPREGCASLCTACELQNTCVTVKQYTKFYDCFFFMYQPKPLMSLPTFPVASNNMCRGISHITWCMQPACLIMTSDLQICDWRTDTTLLFPFFRVASWGWRSGALHCIGCSVCLLWNSNWCCC